MRVGTQRQRTLSVAAIHCQTALLVAIAGALQVEQEADHVRVNGKAA